MTQDENVNPCPQKKTKKERKFPIKRAGENKKERERKFPWFLLFNLILLNQPLFRDATNGIWGVFFPFCFICCSFVCISLHGRIEDNVHFKCGGRFREICFLFSIFYFLFFVFLFSVFNFYSIFLFFVFVFLFSIFCFFFCFIVLLFLLCWHIENKKI